MQPLALKKELVQSRPDLTQGRKRCGYYKVDDAKAAKDAIDAATTAAWREKDAGVKAITDVNTKC